MNVESTEVKNNLLNNNASVLLGLVNLTCIREERLLFDQLNFDVHAGDIIQVEGHNGSGKTSLLRILSGLSQPFEGQVTFKGSPIENNSECFHQQLIYLGHLPGVKGEMTATENLQFTLGLQGIHSLNQEAIESILAKVNLAGFEDSLASHLSAGQHRRISLARLYAPHEASIWILDEPFTAIDKEGVLALEALFLAHTEKGGCIILTTHQDLITIPPSQIKKITLDYSFE